MTAQITKGSGNVTVNGLPVARVNDATNGVTASEAGSIATAAAGQVVTSTLSNMQQAIAWGNTTIDSVNGVFQMTAPLTIPPFSGSLPGANNAVPTIDLVQRMITGGGVTFPITVVQGGTGANNAVQARANLGLANVFYSDGSVVGSNTFYSTKFSTNASNGATGWAELQSGTSSAYGGSIAFYGANGSFQGYIGHTDGVNLNISSAGGLTNIVGSLMVAGSATSGNTTINGVLTANGVASVNGPLNVFGQASVAGTLTANNFSGNSSGVNTGDQTIPTTLPPSGAAGGSLSGSYPNPSLANTAVSAGTYGDAAHVVSMTVGPDGRVTSAANVAISSTSPVGSAGGVLTGSYPNPTANTAYAFSQLQIGSADGYTMIVSPDATHGGYIRFYDPSGVAATYIGNANNGIVELGSYGASWSNRTSFVGNINLTSNTAPFVLMPNSGYLASWPGGAYISSGPGGGTVICGSTNPSGGTGLSAVATTGASFIAGNTTSTFFSVGGDGTTAAGALRVVGTPAGWSPYTEGGYMVWNYTAGGRTDFVNNQGGGIGGWTFTNANSSGGSQVQMVSIGGTPSFSNSLVVNGGISSIGSMAGNYFQDRSGSTQWTWYATGNTAYLWNGSGNVLSVSPAGTLNATVVSAATAYANLYVSSYIAMGTTGGGECHIFMNMANNTPYLYFNSTSFGMYSGTSGSPGLYFSVDASVGTFAMQHNATVAGSLTVGASNVMTGDGWFRSSGQTGWYSTTYGGGWYMTDTTYVRSFSNKAVTASDFVISSDRKLKTAITDMKPRARLRPRTFTMKATGAKKFGFIAQEIEIDYPEAVGEVKEEDGSTTKQVSYSILAAALAAQVNDLSDQVIALKSQVAQLMESHNGNQQLQRSLHQTRQRCNACHHGSDGATDVPAKRNPWRRIVQLFRLHALW